MTEIDTGGSAPADWKLPVIRIPALLTFAALIAGIAAGTALRGTDAADPLEAIATPVGTLWLNALKMAILPLVAGLLFSGITQAAALARAGPMARRTLALFAAVLTGGAVASLLATPALLAAFPIPGGAVDALSASTGQAMPAAIGTGAFIAGIVPDNVFMAAANGAMLPLVVFIALFALAANRLPPPQRLTLQRLFAALAAAMMVIVGWVLAVAPIGVFALAFTMSVASGGAVIGALIHYIVIVSAVGLLVTLSAYLLVAFAGAQTVRRFAGAMLPAQTVAISTQSSLASLPAMIVACRNLGVKDSSDEFVLPLAVAVFKATSPAMNFAVAYYVARLAGIEPGVVAMIAGAGVAVLCSIGVAGVPSAVSFLGTLVPVAATMGAPLEPLAILIAVEMLPDIVRTLGNVTMNVAVTTVVDRSAGLAPERIG